MEISRVTRSRLSITLPAECLQILRIVGPAIFARHDVVDFQGALICGYAAELAPKPRSLQDLVADAPGNFAEGRVAMFPYPPPAFLLVVGYGLITEPD